MWDLPGPGLEPVFPALASKFLTTTTPGKSPEFILKTFLLYSGVWLIYNVVLVSGAHQSHLVIHIHISILFQILLAI